MGFFKSLKSSSYLLYNLVSRDFKLKYRRSVLGVLWSVLNPLLSMIVLTAVFSKLFRFSIEYYPVYLILGNTLFAMMSDGVGTAMSSIISSSSLIKKIKIEKIVFPVEKVLFSLVNFLFSFVAVVLVLIFFQVPPSTALFAVPLVVFMVLVFSIGLGLLLSALATFFRDVLHLWGVLISLWTYLTPLFYPVEILPDWMLSIVWWNPMYHYVGYFRDTVLYQTMPGITETLVCLGMAVATFFIGYAVFRKLQGRFILYI